MTHWLHSVLLACAASTCVGDARAQEVLSLHLDRAPVALSPRGEHVAGPGLVSVPPPGVFMGAALWTPGAGWEELGGPGSPGGPGFAVSNDGNVVLANGAGAGGIWVRGVGWGPLGFPGTQRGMALSSDGRHVAAQAGQGANQPYIWDRSAASFTRLKLPVGAVGAEVSGVSLGAILSVGTAHYPGGATRAAAWDAAGAAIAIAPIGSRATAVSENGEWAAGEVTSAQGTAPFRWNRSIGRLDLPPLASQGGPGGASSHVSSKVSDDGALVIGNRMMMGVRPEGFAWTPTGGTRSFAGYLQSEGFGAVAAFTGVISAASDGRRFILTDGAPAGLPRFFNVDAQVSSSYCGSGSVNSTGLSGATVLLGTNNPDRNALFLRAKDLPAGALVVPLASRDAALLPMAGGSVGTLCLGGAVGRFSMGQTSLGGTLEVRVDVAQIPTPAGPIPGLSGQTWRFQCWYRDAAAVGSNFTDGVRVLLD